MFTGIVQGKGRVAAIDHNPFGLRLTVEQPGWSFEHGYVPEHGHSICVSGCCLTVAEATDAGLAFDVIAETLNKTTLGELEVGSEVNLEPAVTPTQPMGGHFMQGHVDAVGEVTAVHNGEDEWRTTVRPPAELMRYLIPKGSVAIDGISLTIAAVHNDAFDVALIPTTLDLTTLTHKKAGDRVNLEMDILSKTIVAQLERILSPGEGQGQKQGQEQPDPGVTHALLARAGFVKTD